MIGKKNFIKINDYLWQIDRSFRAEMRVPARVYASEKMIDDILKDKSIAQLINGTTLPGIVNYGIAMPDCHEGYSVPIGFVGPIRSSDGIISPGACGFDINCGVRLLKSEWQEHEIKPFLEKLIFEIEKIVPSGLGRGRKIKISIKEVDKILNQGAERLIDQGYGEKADIDHCESFGRMGWACSETVSLKAKNRGRDQLGTLGSGNHFCEIQKVVDIFDEKKAETFGLFKGQIVIMIHCGSRGLGHQVCSDYLEEFIPLMKNKYKINISDREFACVPFNSSHGQKYFQAMAAAANYAWANRQAITYFIRKAWQNILEKKYSLPVLYDVAHNIIKKENYYIEGKETELIVHRKGATRAFPPGHPEIPLSYKNVGQPVLLPGTMGTFSYIMAGTEKGKNSFYSTAHGAGRTMSRKAALRAISGQNVINELKSKGVIVKCQNQRGIAEEAPFAYKDIEEVVSVVDNAGLSLKVAKLAPLAVIKGE